MDDESNDTRDRSDPADIDFGINSPKGQPRRRDSYSPTTDRKQATVGQGGAKIYEYCQVLGMKIHYRLRRSADPECKDVLFLYHGFLSHMFTWERIFDDLAELTGLNVLGAPLSSLAIFFAAFFRNLRVALLVEATVSSVVARRNSSCCCGCSKCVATLSSACFWFLLSLSARTFSEPSRLPNFSLGQTCVRIHRA